MKELFKATIYIFLGFILGFSTYVLADTNGIWYETSDIRGGTFGSDEQDVTSFYSFINPVNFNSNVYFNDWVGVMTQTPTVELEVNGTIKVNTLLADNLVNQRCGTHQAIVGYDENGDIICETIYEYFWQTGLWGSCEGACGTVGTQYRSIWCEREDGITVDDEFCENGADDPMPAASQSCNTPACEFSTGWVTLPTGLRCSTYGNGACNVNFYVNSYTGVDSSEYRIKNIYYNYRWAQGSSTCSSGRQFYFSNTGSQTYRSGGGKYFQTRAYLFDRDTGYSRLRGEAGGWGGCQSGSSCNACISNIRVRVTYQAK